LTNGPRATIYCGEGIDGPNSWVSTASLSDTQTGGGEHASKEKGCKAEEVEAENSQVSSSPIELCRKRGLLQWRMRWTRGAVADSLQELLFGEHGEFGRVRLQVLLDDQLLFKAKHMRSMPGGPGRTLVLVHGA
jgi:hypothetical protein